MQMDDFEALSVEAGQVGVAPTRTMIEGIQGTDAYAVHLQTLAEMGYYDQQRLVLLLDQHGGSLQHVVHELISG
jgi:hypothetical protein